MTKTTGKTAAKAAAAATTTEAQKQAAATETQTNAEAQAAADAQAKQDGEQQQSTATDSAQTEAAAAIGADVGDQDEAPAPSLVAKFGPDAMQNGDAAQSLVELGFPLKVEVTNEMPCRVTFPELKGLLLAHVAGLPELKTKSAVFSNADQLHRFVTDVHALCVFNSFKEGVTVTVA